MRALDRKVLRDLARQRGQAVAIGLLVACAVTTFVGSRTTHRALARSRDQYYDENRFAHVFAPLARAPEPVAARLAELPGVAAVETRVVADVPLEVDGMDEPATARLLSVPVGRPATVNALHLRAGRDLAPGDGWAALASEAFASAHGLGPGDAVTAIVAGRRQRIAIVGIALSPEFIFQVKPGDLMPDDRHFGVLWLPRAPLAAALCLEGAFDDAVLRLAPGADLAAVLDGVDRILGPFGGTGAHGRDRSVSDRFLADELRQLEATAIVVPGIFLLVAAFLLHVVLTRLVATQREQIATLKALGFSSLAVGAHYAKLVLLVVAAGCAVGLAGGAWLGEAMTRMYADFYRFPRFDHRLDAGPVAVAASLAGLAALVGVAGAVRRVVSLPPAEAMRPEPPATFRPTLLERLGLGRLLSQPGRMVLRGLGRRPVRAALSALGLALAVAVIVVGAFFDDAMDRLMTVQFHEVQRDDVTVTFARPLPVDTLQDLRRLPGVLAAEPFRAVPVVLRAGHRSYRTSVLGLEPGARLRRVVDEHAGAMPVPPEGMLLTGALAATLGVRAGDTVLVEVTEGLRPTRQVRVAALVDELLGVSAYMSAPALGRLLDEAPAASGALLAVAADRREEVHARLRGMPAVAGVTLRSAALASFESVSAKYILAFAAVLVAFAAVIAGGVVYNSARVLLAERERELATLRVIGFTRGEVARVILGELATHAALAIPAGWALGWLLARLTAAGMDSDLFRIPVVVEPTTYGLAAGVVLAAGLVVALVVARRVARLDLIDVLKTRE